MSASFLRQPWVRWAVRLVGVALILYLGLTVRQLRTKQQAARSRGASTIWFSMRNLTQNVDAAARQLRDGRGDAAVILLRQSEEHLEATNNYVSLYYAVSPDGSATFGSLLLAYEEEISRLWYAIDLAPAVNDPAYLPEVLTLHADLEQWNTAFTEELLARGTPTQLRAAVQVVCQNIQAPEIRKYGC